jgi:hypothetical protein
MTRSEIIQKIKELKKIIDQPEGSVLTASALEGVKNQARMELDKLNKDLLNSVREDMIVLVIDTKDKESESKLAADLSANNVPAINAQEFYYNFARETSDLFRGQFPLDAIVFLQASVNALLSFFGLRLQTGLISTTVLGGQSVEDNAKTVIRTTLGPGGIEPYYVMNQAISTMTLTDLSPGPILVAAYNTDGADLDAYIGNYKFKRGYKYSFDKAPDIKEFVKTVRSDLIRDGIVKKVKGSNKQSENTDDTSSNESTDNT